MLIRNCKNTKVGHTDKQTETGRERKRQTDRLKTLCNTQILSDLAIQFISDVFGMAGC